MFKTDISIYRKTLCILRVSESIKRTQTNGLVTYKNMVNGWNVGNGNLEDNLKCLFYKTTFIESYTLLNRKNDHSTSLNIVEYRKGENNSVEQPKVKIGTMDKPDCLDPGNLLLNIMDATKGEYNSVEQPHVKVEVVDKPDYVNLDNFVKCESNLAEQPKVKLETIGEFVCWESTYSCASKQELDDINAKNEVLSEEYHIPFKVELPGNISTSIEQQYRSLYSTQNFSRQETSKRNHRTYIRNVLSRVSKGGELHNQCCLCGRSFLSTPDYFLFHLLCYHSNAKYLKRNLLHKIRHLKKPLTKKDHRSNYKIYPKPFLFSRKYKKYSHLHDEKKRNCLKRFKQFSKKSKARVMRSRTNQKLFKCEISLKEFSSTKVSMDSHTDETRLKCEKCLKKFNYKTSLLCHMRSHTGEKPFKCEICSKQFSQKSNLTVHLRRHTHKIKFQCEICTKEFKTKSSLIYHVRRHTGEKLIECEICSKQFNVKSTLLRHMRSHTGEKPYECEVCLKQFSRKSNLTVHMHHHTGQKPFKCDICSKQFGDRSNLNRHMRFHTGEKPYKCDVCLKQFTRNSTLTLHKQCHTDSI